MRGAQDTDQHAALVAFHLQLLLTPLGVVADRFTKLYNEFLSSTPGTSHLRCQAVSANPEETDRLLMSPRGWDACTARVSLHFWHGRQTPQLLWWHVRQLGFLAKTNSTNGTANKVVVLRATSGGSPLCNVARRQPSRRNGDTLHDAAYSLRPFCRPVAAEVSVFKCATSSSSEPSSIDLP